jgi:thymidine phosphorylase
MNALDVIRTKRDGGELSDAQIRFFLEGYTAERIPDEQASALLMAIVFRGLQPRELATWTAAMIESGTRLDLESVGRPTVDKHSTGGVGDKVSLILCPLVAACGAAVPQLSGRGLGHTGGTLDKLESIPGWRAQLGSHEVLHVLRTIGAVICAASDDLAPADRKLYALRDVTGTVESIPLISSSIMSKKIAEGTDSLVLDVKTGGGAFLPPIEQARELARTMVGIGNDNGVHTVALITDMEWPLGLTAGNGIEVEESIEVLAGGGPADVVELTLALAEEMCRLAGVVLDPHDVLASGRAMDKWREMIRAQGGDPHATLARARENDLVLATASGVLQHLDARAVGNAAWRLGAGRARKEDPVSPTAGVRILVKPGERVEVGQPVLELLADDTTRFGDARNALDGAIVINERDFVPRPLVHERIGSPK